MVCAGQLDPLIPAEGRERFLKLMRDANADCQYINYAQAGHSFTDKTVDAMGMPGFNYHAPTDRRSWAAMRDLFDEVLGSGVSDVCGYRSRTAQRRLSSSSSTASTTSISRRQASTPIIPVQYYLRGDDDEVLGGLLGYIWGDWMHISSLWVAVPARGKGHARAMMAAAEAYAKQTRLHRILSGDLQLFSAAALREARL